MTTSSYRYKSIASPDTIRLIHIHPSPDLEAEIKCSLAHVTLNACAQDITEHYVALSYVWGDAALECTIWVDGQSLAITASLHCALRYLRDGTRVIRVWADGVCIDQKSNEDRSFQVAMMGSIYSIATHTVIFLSEPTPELELTMELLESRLSGIQSVPVSDEEQLVHLIQDNILTRPWFSRVWVLQELVLSVSPWVQGGKFRVKWNAFSSYVRESDSASWSPNSRDLLTGMTRTRWDFNNIRSLRDISGAPSSDPFAELFQILESRRGSGVSDPRDMVYAHLGLISPFTRNMIDVDYKKSVAEVYEGIARRHIEKHGDTTILSYVEKLDPCDRREGLPSWVPDWGRVGPVKLSKLDPEKFTEMDIDTVEKFRFHTRVRPGCIGCVQQIPRVLGLVGWDLGPIASIIPASSFPSLDWDEYAPRECRSADSLGASSSVPKDGDLAHRILKWIGESETSMPEIVRSVLERYKVVAQPIWNKIQPWDWQDLRDAHWGIPHDKLEELSRRSFLRDVVTAWFPITLTRRNLPQKKKNKLLSEFQNIRFRLASRITFHVINAIGNMTICRSSDLLPVVLESGDFAIVLSQARVGQHIFRVLDDNRLLLLDQYNATEALEDKFSSWLEACGKELKDYHRRGNIQKLVNSFKFVADNASCEVYDGETGHDVSATNSNGIYFSARKDKYMNSLGIITLH